METRMLILSLVLGVTLGFIPFVAFPFALFQLGAAALTLPMLFSVVTTSVLSYALAKKYEDPKGVTWYGRYGDSPAGKLLWAAMYTACLVLAAVAFYYHFPGFGSHYVTIDSPLHAWITERRCVDHPTKALDLCTPQLCNATRTGDKEFADRHCEEHPETCVSVLKITSLDWAMSNCLGTCGCDRDRDPFNPHWYTSAEITFECERTGSCGYRNSRTSVAFAYIKYPSLIEIHVFTGCIIMTMFPLQYLKAIRMWKNKLFHRWNGRIMVALVVPNQITAAAMAVVGILDTEVGMHGYTTMFRMGAGLATVPFAIFVGKAVYYIKVKRDIPKHAENMMRAGSIWFGIPFFRMLMPFFEAFVGSRWTFGISGWVCFIVPSLLTEVYIRKSERFVTPSHMADKGADVIVIGAATVSDGSSMGA